MSCCNSVQENRQVLLGDAFVRELSARPVPADRDPDGVADESVGQFKVEIVLQRAGLDALREQRHPDITGLRMPVGEVAEPVTEATQPVGLVLEDCNLRM